MNQAWLEAGRRPTAREGYHLGTPPVTISRTRSDSWYEEAWSQSGIGTDPGGSRSIPRGGIQAWIRTVPGSLPFYSVSAPCRHRIGTGFCPVLPRLPGTFVAFLAL